MHGFSQIWLHNISELNTAHKIFILATQCAKSAFSQEMSCRTEVLNMSRLLKNCLQQHSTPGVLPYEQIESVTLVDAKWTRSVQTLNPVALTEFPGRIWLLLVVFKAADRGMTQEVMICRVKMSCCWWSFKPTVSPVITMAIHTFVQWTFGFSYLLFVATAARDQIHNILWIQ